MQRRVGALERRAAQLMDEIASLEHRRDEVRADLVRYERRPGAELVRAADVKPQRTRIRVEREDRVGRDERQSS
jgi:hypothetical protein